jgi:hypothetical protein
MSGMQIFENAFVDLRKDAARYSEEEYGSRGELTFEVVSCEWGIRSTWTVRARRGSEAIRKASEDLSKRSYCAYIVSVRRLDARMIAEGVQK